MAPNEGGSPDVRVMFFEGLLMPLEQQNRCLEILNTKYKLANDNPPAWLNRPGKVECGRVWPTMCAAHRALTSRELPEAMPPREHRTLDAIFRLENGRCFVFEFDEAQHFNRF